MRVGVAPAGTEGVQCGLVMGVDGRGRGLGRGHVGGYGSGKVTQGATDGSQDLFPRRKNVRVAIDGLGGCKICYEPWESLGGTWLEN
jgi:hypothetical protein